MLWSFQKVVRQTGLYAKDLDLSFFYPFKDVTDNFLLDEKDIVVEEEVGEEQGADDADV